MDRLLPIVAIGDLFIKQNNTTLSINDVNCLEFELCGP
jgi:hypothetical protein